VTGLDRSFSRLVLGAIVPVLLMLVGWWGSLGIGGDGPWIRWSALAGLVLGCLINATLLRRWTVSLYDLTVPALLGVAVFYSVMIYGVFMGFPVVNLLVGVAAGFVVGRRAVLGEKPGVAAGRERRRASVAAALLMAALCAVTAWLALTDPYTAGDVRGMLGLSFTPSVDQLRLLALLGGVALVVTEYAATSVTAGWAARLRSAS
jgi:hypothetical protein